MKSDLPRPDQEVTVRYQPEPDCDEVTVTGKVIRYEGSGQNLGLRISSKKIRWIRTDWIIVWHLVTSD